MTRGPVQEADAGEKANDGLMLPRLINRKREGGLHPIPELNLEHLAMKSWDETTYPGFDNGCQPLSNA